MLLGLLIRMIPWRVQNLVLLLFLLRFFRIWHLHPLFGSENNARQHRSLQRVT